MSDGYAAERSRKPKGWYSAQAKAERAAARAYRKRTRALTKQIGESRKRKREKMIAGMAAAAAPIVSGIILGTAVQRHADIVAEERNGRRKSEARKLRHVINERVRTKERLSATPERLAKTNEPFVVVGEDQAQEIADWPLERLFRAGSLGSDEELAEQRCEAGQRLYAHWYYGRMFPLGSRDYRKPYSGGSDPFSIMPATERQAFHRIRWREADACLGGDRIASVTRAIVLEEKEPADVGRVITGRTHLQSARAVAIEYLIDGLDRLRTFWRRA